MLDSLRASPQKDIWEKALSNEWGRLAQGKNYGVIPTDTITFIHRHEVPTGSVTCYKQLDLDKDKDKDYNKVMYFYKYTSVRLPSD